MSSTSTHDVQSDVREMWRTRPVRTPDDKKVAGVCGGIGRRYGVDPVLIRVAFVVTALWGGAGVFLYALSWLLMRSPGDEVSMGEALFGKGRSSGSKGLAIVLIIVAVIAAPTFGGSGETIFLGAGVLMAVALLAGWYGLHKRTPAPPAGWAEVSSVRPPDTPRPRVSDYPAGQEPGSGPGAPYGPPVPPSWDPLGAAPFAWDLPEPGSAPEPEPAKPKSRLTKVTLGLAVIATAVSVGLAQFAGITWLTATTIAAIALAVVAGGLLVGAVTRRGHGLLVVAGPLAGFVLLASLIHPYIPEGGWENAGDRRYTVATEGGLATPVVHNVGSIVVDMRDLVLERDRSYSISNDVGEVRVELPADLDVRVTCSTDVGTARCPGGTDHGADGPGGPVLTLDVSSDVGDVTVVRP